MAQAAVEHERPDEEYVFVVSASPTNSTHTYPSYLSLEEAPTSIPFLPLPLDASTEITKHGGYSEAIKEAQKFIDSRLDIYSKYRKMVKVPLSSSAALLTPRSKPKIDVEHDFVKIPSVKKVSIENIGLGWKQVKSIDEISRGLLMQLEKEGVLYTPHDTAYSVKYLQPVAPFGDCLFLSMEQIINHTEGCIHISPMQIRKKAVESFWEHYSASSLDEKQKIDKTIKNLYKPDLSRGWGVSPIQSHRYVASVSDRDILLAKALTLQDQGNTWNTAAEIVYSENAQPVVNAKTFCRYMMVGNPGNGENFNEDFLITLNYSSNGLLSIDNDPDSRRVSWGDDIVLESLATAYNRDIFVVLIGGGKMFFLPHRPRSKDDNSGLAPWFLIMRSTGGDRGGDHYEPMVCQRLRGDASPSLTSIGD